MRTPVAFVDANVLLSKTLRLWLFMLRTQTSGGLFVLHSTANLLSVDQLSTPAWNRITSLLDDVIEDSPDAADLRGADERTNRVHAAALVSNAIYVIVDPALYSNVNTDELPYEVHTPDSFFMLIAANSADAVDRVIGVQLGSVEGSKSPHVELANAGCPDFAECVLQHMQSTFSGKSTHGIADKLLMDSISS